MITGTLLNVLTVLIGSGLGLLIGNRLPPRLHTTIMNGLGLSTCLFGIQQALKTNNLLILLGSILLGGLLGDLLRIEDRLAALGNTLQRRLTRRPKPSTESDPSSPIPNPQPPSPGSRFSEGFVTASLVWCVGPMTILGSIENGLTGQFPTLALKSTLDGFSAFAFAAALGWGVPAAAVVLFVFQGSLSLGAFWLRDLLTPAMITEMSAAGGLMVLGIGLKLLAVKDVRVGNFLPALVIAPLIVRLLNP
jgi:uncharacterized membrane protein YqgA involved in biofilm formation